MHTDILIAHWPLQPVGNLIYQFFTSTALLAAVLLTFVNLDLLFFFCLTMLLYCGCYYYLKCALPT